MENITFYVFSICDIEFICCKGNKLFRFIKTFQLLFPFIKIFYYSLKHFGEGCRVLFKLSRYNMYYHIHILVVNVPKKIDHLPRLVYIVLHNVTKVHFMPITASYLAPLIIMLTSFINILMY